MSKRLLTALLVAGGGILLFAFVSWLVFPGEMVAHFTNWDGGHYIRIASQGYQLDYPWSFAFYPLFSLEIWLISQLGLSTSTAAVVAGWANAVLLLAAASWFFAIMRRDSVWHLLLFCTLPFSFFFFMSYTEALFLVLFFIIAACIFAPPTRATTYILPIACALIAIARVTGLVVVAAAAGYMLLEKDRLKTSRIIPVASSVIAALATLFTFFLYNWHKTSDFFFSAHVQTLWDRGRSLNVFAPIVELVLDRFAIGCGVHAICPVDMLYMVGSCALFIIGGWHIHKSRLPARQKVFFAATSILPICLALSTGTTASISRYMLVTPYVFFGISSLLYVRVSRKILLIIIVLGMLFNAYLFTQFAQGAWVS